jgi:hypothetical protein
MNNTNQKYTHHKLFCMIPVSNLIKIRPLVSEIKQSAVGRDLPFINLFHTHRVKFKFVCLFVRYSD